MHATTNMFTFIYPTFKHNKYNITQTWPLLSSLLWCHGKKSYDGLDANTQGFPFKSYFLPSSSKLYKPVESNCKCP